jgi:hypothetical protein
MSCHRFEAALTERSHPMVEWRGRDSTVDESFFASGPDLGQTALQEALFRFLPREAKRDLIAGLGRPRATEPA